MERGRSEILEVRSAIRTIKDSLTSAGAAPSKEDVRKEVVLEARIERLTEIAAEAEKIRDELEATGDRWAEVQSLLSALPTDGLSNQDKRKLSDLEGTFKTLLQEFDYKSTRIDELHISPRSYKPAVENIELGSEASASDNIRMIWAYLYSLMVVSRSPDYVTHHLGLLILDEPRQQEAKEVSFNSFIKAAADSMEYDQQIIIGTSEKQSELEAAIAGLPVRQIHFDDNLIGPLVPLS